MLFDTRKCRDRDLLAVHLSIPRGQENREGISESKLGTERFSPPVRKDTVLKGFCVGECEKYQVIWKVDLQGLWR